MSIQFIQCVLNPNLCKDVFPTLAPYYEYIHVQDSNSNFGVNPTAATFSLLSIYIYIYIYIDMYIYIYIHIHMFLYNFVGIRVDDADKNMGSHEHSFYDRNYWYRQRKGFAGDILLLEVYSVLNKKTKTM